MENAWTYTTNDILAHFGVNPSFGLTQEAVSNSQKIYGRNGTPHSPLFTLLNNRL